MQTTDEEHQDRIAIRIAFGIVLATMLFGVIAAFFDTPIALTPEQEKELLCRPPPPVAAYSLDPSCVMRNSTW